MSDAVLDPSDAARSAVPMPLSGPAGADRRGGMVGSGQPAGAQAGGGQAFDAGRWLAADHHPDNGTLLGFWLYLMSDCLVFACLFACYGVLGRSYDAGPSGADLFDLRLIAVNTALLLFSSITYGFAMLGLQQRRLATTQLWLAVTGLFGLGFLGIELFEFHHLIADGAGPQRSAFLSSFFALVGTHGLHVTFGVIWLATLMVQLRRWGFSGTNRRRLWCLSMFWHFLDVVWIGVFTFVYLMGVLP